ncbi:MAG: HD domain-containing protein [Chloroherpetonaceae bacterium]
MEENYGKIPTREEAWALLLEYNQSQSLINHALSVESVMRHFARLNGEDEEKWGIIGLVHDFDYEKYPDQHCSMTKKILEEHNWNSEWIRAILSHAYGFTTDIEPQSLLEKTLYAIDELTGLITAVTLVRPSKKLAEVEVKSVKKKWKEKQFASGVNREVIQIGAEKLGTPLDELIAESIKGMQEVADKIGL